MNLGIDRLKTVSELAQRLTTILRKLIARVSSIESKIESGEIGGGSNSGPANLDDKVPVGSIQPFAGEKGNIPNKWLLCDGSAISRSTYPQLFSIIGETYGAGDGSTTFNLPDLRGEFIRGFDDGRGVDSGRTFGSNQLDEFKSHIHYIENIYAAGASITPAPNFSASGATKNKPLADTNSSGGSETRPRNVALNYIIRVDVDTSPAPVAYEVPDGSITTAKLGANAVTYDKSAIFPLGGNRTVRYYRNTDFNVADNGTVTVTFNIPDFGVNDYIVRSGNQYICQANGIYLINASVYWNSVSNRTYARTDLMILINGSLRKRHRTVVDRGDNHTNEATLSLYLGAGDIIQVQVNHNITPNATRRVGGYQETTFLNITYLGA